MQFRISAIKYTPTIEEIEGVKARLRMEIYMAAKKEAQRIGELLGHRINVFRIDFREPVSYRPLGKSFEHRSRAAELHDKTSVDRRIKVRIRALVVLGTCPSEAK